MTTCPKPIECKIDGCGSSIFWLFLFACLFSLCCSQHIPNARVPRHHAPISAPVFHGDVDFTTQEREWIFTAVTGLTIQSGGYFSPTVVFDLDFGDPITLRRLTAEPGLIRLSELAPVVEMTDITNGGEVLAFTDVKAQRSFFVFERLYQPEWSSRDMWIRVLEHEILHTAGVDHNGGVCTPGDTHNECKLGSPLWGDQRSLMNVLSNRFHLQTCMNHADAVSLCGVLRCDPEETNYCE